MVRRRTRRRSLKVSEMRFVRSTNPLFRSSASPPLFCCCLRASSHLLAKKTVVVALPRRRGIAWSQFLVWRFAAPGIYFPRLTSVGTLVHASKRLSSPRTSFCLGPLTGFDARRCVDLRVGVITGRFR